MAKIEASIRTPSVPGSLEVTFPGRARPSRLPLSAFSEEELSKVGAEWTALLIEASKAQVENPPTPRKPRAPKAE